MQGFINLSTRYIYTHSPLSLGIFGWKCTRRAAPKADKMFKHAASMLKRITDRLAQTLLCVSVLTSSLSAMIHFGFLHTSPGLMADHNNVTWLFLKNSY